MHKNRIPPTRGMTHRAYAQHRKCSESTVWRAVRDGRITVDPGGIDPTTADAQWQASTRAKIDSKGAADAAVSEGYRAARARREEADAQLAELKLLEMAGVLIRVDAIRADVARSAVRMRDALMGIGARIAPVVAHKTDVQAVEAILRAELEAALKRFEADAVRPARA